MTSPARPIPISAHDATATYTCKAAGCTNEARSSRGLYSYCDEHRGRSGQPTRPSRGSAVDQLSKLTATARSVDKLRAKAEELTQRALDAKRAADDAEADYREQLRQATAARGDA